MLDGLEPGMDVWRRRRRSIHARLERVLAVPHLLEQEVQGQDAALLGLLDRFFAAPVD